MKKLLTLLICCSLSVPSFGIDRFIQDKIHASLLGETGANLDFGYHYTDSDKTGVNVDLSYHYTNSVKISFGPVIEPIYREDDEVLGTLGLMAKLHYYHKLKSTNITPYITAGIGIAYEILEPKCKDNKVRKDIFDTIYTLLRKAFKCSASKKAFSYQIGGGINLPLSERMSIFAGYKLQKLHEISHGVEFGVSFNL